MAKRFLAAAGLVVAFALTASGANDSFRPPTAGY